MLFEPRPTYRPFTYEPLTARSDTTSLLVTAFPAALAANSTEGPEQGSTMSMFQIVGFGLILGIVLFLMLSYTCHMLSVFASPRDTVQCIRLSDAIKAFSSFNTARSKSLQNISTPIANKRIATATRSIGLAMSNMLSPTSSDSGRIAWYSSMDKIPGTVSARISQHPCDEYTLDATELTALSPNNSAQFTRVSSGSNQNSRPDVRCSAFSNATLAESEFSPEVEADLFSFGERSRTDTFRSHASVEPTLSADTGDLASGSQTNQDFGVANESGPASQETLAEETGSRSTLGEEPEIPPSRRVRRTSSLPQMSSFVIQVTNSRGVVGGLDMETVSEQSVENSGVPNSNDNLQVPTNSAISTPHLYHPVLKTSPSWAHEDLPGVENYVKHHGAAKKSNSNPKRTVSTHNSPSNSPAVSVSDVYRMKQQQYAARKGTMNKRYRPSVKNQETKSTPRLGSKFSFRTGASQRLQNLW